MQPNRHHSCPMPHLWLASPYNHEVLVRIARHVQGLRIWPPAVELHVVRSTRMWGMLVQRASNSKAATATRSGPRGDHVGPARSRCERHQQDRTIRTDGFLPTANGGLRPCKTPAFRDVCTCPTQRTRHKGYTGLFSTRATPRRSHCSHHSTAHNNHRRTTHSNGRSTNAGAKGAVSRRRMHLRSRPRNPGPSPSRMCQNPRRLYRQKAPNKSRLHHSGGGRGFQQSSHSGEGCPGTKTGDTCDAKLLLTHRASNYQFHVRRHRRPACTNSRAGTARCEASGSSRVRSGPQVGTPLCLCLCKTMPIGASNVAGPGSMPDVPAGKP
jgi:hypothetical protein